MRITKTLEDRYTIEIGILDIANLLQGVVIMSENLQFSFNKNTSYSSVKIKIDNDCGLPIIEVKERNA